MNEYNQKVKVLVGCPTSDYKSYCIEEYVDSIKSLTYSNYDILIVDNSKGESYYNKIKSLGVNVKGDKFQKHARDRIVSSRNMIREYMIENNYDYFLSLEQDVIPPRDIIERMLAHKKDVVTGVYFAMNFHKGKDQLMPLVWVDFNKETRRMFYIDDERLYSDKLIEIAASGLGCVLIHRAILKQFEFRYVKKENAFDDVWFYKDLRENNIRIFCDTSLKCKHLVKNWSWQNIKQ